MRYKRYLKRLRNFDIAIMLAVVMSIPLSVLLHLHGADEFDLEELLNGSLFNAIADRDVFPETLFDFAALCTTVSAFRYTGRSLDIACDEKTLLYPLLPDVREKIHSELKGREYRNKATIMGLILALFLAVTLGFLLAFSGAWSAALLLTFLMGSLVLLSACCGFFSRLGQVLDRAKSGKTLNRNYELSIIGSVVSSIIPITLFLGYTISMATLPFNPLAIFTLACTALVFMSSMSSGAHYLGLGLDFLTNDRSVFFFARKKKDINPPTYFLDRCNNEKLATIMGVVLGVALGITLVSLGICMPAFLAVLPVLLKAPLVVLMAVNMCASFSANIGRIIDRILASYTHHPKTILHVLFNREPSRQEINEKKLTTRKRAATWDHFPAKLIENDSFQRNSMWKFKKRFPAVKATVDEDIELKENLTPLVNYN